MAVKHIKEYYNQVCDQYMLMQAEIKEFQHEVEEGLVEPERVESMKKMLEPIKNNYMTLSWIMFLLNKPARRKKEKVYTSQSKKFTSKLDPKFNKEGIIAENDNALKKLKGV